MSTVERRLLCECELRIGADQNELRYQFRRNFFITKKNMKSEKRETILLGKFNLNTFQFFRFQFSANRVSKIFNKNFILYGNFTRKRDFASSVSDISVLTIAFLHFFSSSSLWKLNFFSPTALYSRRIKCIRQP